MKIKREKEAARRSLLKTRKDLTHANKEMMLLRFLSANNLVNKKGVSRVEEEKRGKKNHEIET